MEYFHIVIQQVLFFVIYGVIGVFAVKAKIMDRDGLDVLARVITRIALPLLIFTNTLNGSTREDFLGALPLLGITVVFYLVLYLVAIPSAKLFRLNGDRRNVYRACFMFGNIGFIGIPIVAALFPAHGMLYIALFTVIDQIALWSVGITLTAPVEEIQQSSVGEIARKLANPAMIGVLLAVVLILLQAPFPKLLNEALTKVGSTATPLALIYLGGIFSYIDIKEALRNKEVYLLIFLKMCVLPIVFFWVIRLTGLVNDEIAVTMGVLCALPGMTSIAMMAHNQGSDVDYCVGNIFVTAVFSIVTLPIICLALGLML